MKQVLAKNGLPRIQGFPGTWIQDNYATMTNLDMAAELGITIRVLERKLTRMRQDGYLPTGVKKRLPRPGERRSSTITVHLPKDTDVNAVSNAVSNYIEKSLATTTPAEEPEERTQEVRVRDTQGRVMGFSADTSSIVDGMLHLWVERDGYQPYIVATWAPGAWAQVWTVEAQAS